MDPLHLTASLADGVSMTGVAHRMQPPCDGHRSPRDGHEGEGGHRGSCTQKTGWLPFSGLWCRALGPANPRNTNGIADGVSTSDFRHADGLRWLKRHSRTASGSPRADVGHHEGKSDYGSPQARGWEACAPCPRRRETRLRSTTSHRIWRYPAGAVGVLGYSVIRAGCSRLADGRSVRRGAGVPLVVACPQPRPDERPVVTLAHTCVWRTGGAASSSLRLPRT